MFVFDHQQKEQCQIAIKVNDKVQHVKLQPKSMLCLLHSKGLVTEAKILT